MTLTVTGAGCGRRLLLDLLVALSVRLSVARRGRVLDAQLVAHFKCLTDAAHDAHSLTLSVQRTGFKNQIIQLIVLAVWVYLLQM